MGGYGGISSKTEKSLKGLKIYEWEDMWEWFCGVVRWGGTVGWYWGVVRIMKSLDVFADFSQKSLEN